LNKNISRPIQGIAQKQYNGYYSQQVLIPPSLSTGDFLRSYGEIGWLFACVSKIAQNVADTEWSAYKTGSDKELTEQQSQALAVLNHPNPFMSRYELMEITQMYLDLTGKCFWNIAKDKAGRAREIWPISPLDMWVLPDTNNYIKGYMYRTGVQTIPFDPDEIIFFCMPNPINPYDGIGPAQGARNSLEMDKYSAQHNRNFFYNGATLSGMINVETNVDDDTFERLKEEFRDNHTGVDNAHKLGFIEGSKANFLNLSLSQKDMDFYNLRQMTRDEILGAFGVHKSILGLTDDVSRANAETAEYTFQKHVVKPRLTRIQDKLNNEFVQIFKEDIELQFTDPTPENKEFLVDTVKELTDVAITKNEARKILNKLLDDVDLKPLENGDTIWQNAMLAPLDSGEENEGDNLPPNNMQDEETQEEQPSKSIKKKIITKAVRKKIQKRIEKNNQTRNEEFQKMAEPLTKEFKSVMQNYLKSMQKDIVSKVLEGNKDPVDLNKWNTELIDKITPLYVKVFKVGGGAVENEFKNIGAYIHKDLNVTFDLRNPKVQKKIQDKVSKITGVNETTKQHVKDKIEEMYNNDDFTIRDIADELSSDDFPEFDKSRATIIAQTEVLSSLNQATIEGYKQNSELIDGKAWLPTYFHTRDTHLQAGEDYSMDNPIKVDDNFVVGGYECECPGDSGLPPAEVCNCACCMAPVVNV
jgi:HK97 family phage portal protein